MNRHSFYDAGNTPRQGPLWAGLDCTELAAASPTARSPSPSKTSRCSIGWYPSPGAACWAGDCAGHYPHRRDAACRCFALGGVVVATVPSLRGPTRSYSGRGAGPSPDRVRHLAVWRFRCFRQPPTMTSTMASMRWWAPPTRCTARRCSRSTWPLFQASEPLSAAIFAEAVGKSLGSAQGLHITQSQQILDAWLDAQQQVASLIVRNAPPAADPVFGFSLAAPRSGRSGRARILGTPLRSTRRPGTLYVGAVVRGSQDHRRVRRQHHSRLSPGTELPGRDAAPTSATQVRLSTSALKC